MYLVTAVNYTYLEITRVFAVQSEAQVYSDYLTSSHIQNRILVLNNLAHPNYVLLTFDKCGRTLQGRLYTSLEEAECRAKKLTPCVQVRIICLVPINCGEPLTIVCNTGPSTFTCS